MENTDYNLTYILVTLLIRFAGVFIVLIVIMFGMMLLGYVTPRVIEAIEKRKQGARKGTELGKILQNAVDSQDEDLSEQEIAAAIGLALELETGARPASSSRPVQEEVRGLASSWVMQGRSRQLRGKTSHS